MDLLCGNQEASREKMKLDIESRTAIKLYVKSIAMTARKSNVFKSRT